MDTSCSLYGLVFCSILPTFIGTSCFIDTLELVDADAKYVYQLGNLLPLDRSTNSLASNKPWSEKRPIYAESSGTLLNQQFLEEFGQETSWTRQMIRARSKKLLR